MPPRTKFPQFFYQNLIMITHREFPAVPTVFQCVPATDLEEFPQHVPEVLAICSMGLRNESLGIPATIFWRVVFAVFGNAFPSDDHKGLEVNCHILPGEKVESLRIRNRDIVS